MGTNYIHLCASINGLMAIPQYIQSNFGLGSRMNSEVHNDTAPDSGGGVSAFETMVTEYREGQEKTRANNRSAPRVGIR